ncbi:MAG: deoxyribodipyrimidine photolyase [Terrimonas sp.]|nr:deoxyribodipyrimidine photolyase [Terrimonas sp.]
MQFPTDYASISERMRHINPVSYALTRNHIDGHVSYLSPYISRGVISTKQVLAAVLDNGFELSETKKFIQELAWREYYQRTWQQLEDGMFTDIRVYRNGVNNRLVPAAIIHGNTGIDSIDQAISELKETGYIHNHLRMYIASMTCNIARSYWQLPSQWMYYFLLDGDLASNTCSWQWVAGSFSSKKYYCNQENINKYTSSRQQHTFLDIPYEQLTNLPIPEVLSNLKNPSLHTFLPEFKTVSFDTSKPLLIYNSYNLDPLWRKDDNVNRVLLLEPSHFRSFPVHEQVIRFIISLADNIKNIQVFTGELNEIPGIRDFPAVISKEHPVFQHYPGQKDNRDWLFPEITGFYNSFFSYWKQCEKYLTKNIGKAPVKQMEMAVK